MWTITYRIHREEPWDDRALRALQQHQQLWARKLTAKASGYNLASVTRSVNASGTTDLDPTTAERDYVTLVSALRELESLFPGTEVFVSDELILTRPVRPGEVDLSLLGERLKLQAGEEGAAGLEEPDAQELAEREKLLGETARILERARHDFEIWKRAQQDKDKERSP